MSQPKYKLGLNQPAVIPIELTTEIIQESAIGSEPLDLSSMGSYAFIDETDPMLIPSAQRKMADPISNNEAAPPVGLDAVGSIDVIAQMAHDLVVGVLAKRA